MSSPFYISFLSLFILILLELLVFLLFLSSSSFRFAFHFPDVFLSLCGRKVENFGDFSLSEDFSLLVLAILKGIRGLQLLLVIRKTWQEIIYFLEFSLINLKGFCVGCLWGQRSDVGLTMKGMRVTEGLLMSVRVHLYHDLSDIALWNVLIISWKSIDIELYKSLSLLVQLPSFLKPRTT